MPMSYKDMRKAMIERTCRQRTGRRAPAAAVVALAAALTLAGGLAAGCASRPAPTGARPQATADAPVTAPTPAPAAAPTDAPAPAPAPATVPAESAKPVPRAKPAKPASQDEEIAALVRQLGDESWDRREAAQKQLLEIGKPAVGRLKAALADSDMEVASRSRALLAEIVGQGFLGVQIRDPEAFDRDGRELPEDGGAVVVETLADTPAAAAGLRPGDFVYSVDGKVVAGSAGMVETIAAIDPGTAVKLVLYRNGKRQEQPITVGRRPKDPGM